MENNRKDRTEQLLKWALEEQLARDPEVLAFLPDDGTGEQHEFSPEHERKMKKIFRMARRVERRPQRRRHMMQAAACFAAVLVVSTVTVSSVEAFRLPVLNFFAEIKEKAISYRLEKEEHIYATVNFREYEPTYVAEGFLAESVTEAAGAYTINYTNPADGRWYAVDFRDKAVSVSLDAEQAKALEDEINGDRVIVVRKDGGLRATLFRDASHIILAGQISWEDAKKVLESIKK